MPRRALVIGAGPAGTAAAIGLHKAGWEAEVFEAYAESAGLGQGVFLTVAVNGLDALASVGADDVVRELGFPTGNIRFLSGSGRELGAMPIGPTLVDGTCTRTVRRADLYAALSEAARSLGIAIHHGRRLRTAASAGQAVEATFEDGSTAAGDLLVGADGLRSRVRELIDPRTPMPRYSGLGNVGGFTRDAGLDVRAEAADGDYRMIWGRRCFFGYTVSPDQEIWWFANPPARHELTREQLADPERLKEHLVDLLSTDRGPAAEIVRATTAPIVFTNQYDLPRIPTWHHERMVLIGDAAHAVSPATGQGVSLAWEDGVTLAHALVEHDEIGRALEHYAQSRRARVDRVTKWGRRMGKTKAVGPLGAAIRDRVLPRILAHGAKPKTLEKQAWLFSHHIPRLTRVKTNA